MDFVIDRVSEDSFYENLLIGLPRVLEELGIEDTCLERALPVQHIVLCTWEQKNGVLLPEDLRSFYASSNGLKYSYNFSFSEESDKDRIEGKIEVNTLSNLSQIFGYEVRQDYGVKVDNSRYELRLGCDSKVFELVNLNDLGRVVLVYLNSKYLPTIWVQNAAMEFYFLADDFTTYLKMCIHHLGIPFWQFAFTVQGLPDYSQMIFRLLSPATLSLNKKLEAVKKSNAFLEEFSDVQINKVDVGIFKTLPKACGQRALVCHSQLTSPIQNKKKQVKQKLHTANKPHRKLHLPKK